MTDKVKETLDNHDLDPILIELEITECSLIRQPQQVIRNLIELNNLEVGIAIDNFGAGYSSLGYLKNLPINKIKLDRSFVADISEDQDDRAITRAIIKLGHNLGLTVVAEGVETQEQKQHLEKESCDEIQGTFECAAITAA